MSPALLPFEVLLTRAALTALAVVGAWSLLVLLAIGAEALSRGRLRIALALGCPPVAHRWVLGLMGGAVALGTLVAPASATSPAAPPAAVAGEPAAPASGRLDGLPLPDRPRGFSPGPGPIASERDEKPRTESSRVWVHEGQSLWAISRGLLPSPTRNRQTAVLARAIYLRNRLLIGKDPDLIRPGQHLTIPARAVPSTSEES